MITNSPARRLIFRADGDATIGLGHLTRLLALADELRGLAPGIFVVREPTAAVAQLLAGEGWPVYLLPSDHSLAAEAEWLATEWVLPNDVLLLDGYGFTTTYQQCLRQSGCGLVFIDDLRAGPVVADVLINHSPGITPADYDAPPAAQLLLGPAFSLLRRPFLEAISPPQAAADISSALICFGGADPLRLTARMLEALLTFPQLRQLSMVVGGAFGDIDALQKLAAQHPDRHISLHQNVAAPVLVTLLRAHAVAVLPASTMLIEALVLGRPAITGYYAKNQQALANYVHTHQQAFSVGNFADLTGTELLVSLRWGLDFLATQPRQPYVDQLRPDLLQAAVQRLLSR